MDHLTGSQTEGPRHGRSGEREMLRIKVIVLPMREGKAIFISPVLIIEKDHLFRIVNA